MSFTIEDKINDLKEQRSLMTNLKVTTTIDRDSAEEEDHFTKLFFYGDSNFIGINDFIKLYFEERSLLFGNTYTHPSLDDWGDTEWEAVFEQSIKTEGDTVNGFYPPDAYGVGAQEMNLNSYYLNNHGETIKGDSGDTGIKLLTKLVLDEIGDTAEHGASWYASDYIYDSSGEATAAGDSYVTSLESNATGVRWWRTKDTTVSTSDDGEGPPPKYRFILGNGSYDTPNAFTNKTDFVGSINILRVELQEGDIKTKLTEIYNEIQDINDNIWFDGLETWIGDTNGDSVSAFSNELDVFIGDSGDSTGDTTLWGLYNHFNGMDGTEAGFDDDVDDLEDFINIIRGSITDRHNAIGNYLGDSVLSSDNLKKARYFWVNQRIGKPISSLINYTGLEYALTLAETNLDNASEKLDIFLGTPEVYIPTPELYAAFENNRLDKETEVLLERRIKVVFSGQQHATRYDIYRKNLKSVAFDNNDWSNDFYLGYISTINNDTGFVYTEYTDTSGLSNEMSFCYRIRCVDTSNDPSYTTMSKQSDVYLEDTEDLFYETINKTDFKEREVTILDLQEEHKFKKRQYILLIPDRFSKVTGFYSIVDTDEMKIYITPQIDLNVSFSGKIYLCNGILCV